MRLGQLSLPLAPMLAVLGAPAEGSSSINRRLGPHGNMVCRSFVSGVTVYLPVAVAGALLFAGDGHALQGDGEIVGAGIEISFDIEITVQSKRASRSPGGEGRIGITSLPWATGGHLINASNMRPVRCCAGCKLTINWIPWGRTCWSVSVFATT